MNKIIDWLDSKSSLIVAIATVVLAIFAFVAHTDTSSILRQQKATEEIQFRAYVSEVSADIKQAIPVQNPKAILSIHYGFKNSGLTPARNLKINAFDTINNITVNPRNVGASTSIIDPGQTLYVYEDVSEGYLDTILNNSGNFLTVYISYDDYLGKTRSQTIKLVSQKGTPGFVNTLGILSQTED